MAKTYESYKDSGIIWIGNIPQNWKIRKFQQLCKIITDYVASGSFADLRNNVSYLDEPDYAMLVRTTDLANSSRSTEKVYISKESYDFLNNSNLFGGEIILPNIGSIGDAYLVPSDLYKKMSLAPNAIMFRTNQSDKFFYYYFLCDAGSNQLKEIAASTAMPKFNKTQLRQLNVVEPPLSEQQTIAAYLDEKCGEIDSLISLQEEMISELQAYKQSVITEAVTKGLDSNVPMKDSGVEWIGAIPKHWNVTRFKNVAKVKANLVHPEDYLEMPQVAPDCIEKGSGKLIKYQTVREANVISDNHLFYKGQIVYSKIRPTLNKVIIAPFNGLCCADMYPIETKENLQFFLLQMLSSVFNEQVAVVVQDRVKMPKINKEELDQIIMICPPLSEQQAIASYLDEKTSQIDSLIALKQEKITELKDYKKSIIYEYVTGKKKV